MKREKKEESRKADKKRTPHLLVEGKGKEKNMFTPAFPSSLFCYFLTLPYPIWSRPIFFLLKGNEWCKKRKRGERRRRKRKEEKKRKRNAHTLSFRKEMVKKRKERRLPFFALPFLPFRLFHFPFFCFLILSCLIFFLMGGKGRRGEERNGKGKEERGQKKRAPSPFRREG